MAVGTGVHLGEAGGVIFAAGLGVVAIETFLAVEVCGEGGCWDRVGIVAGDAAEFAAAVFEALAFVHLLDVVNGFSGAVFCDF